MPAFDMRERQGRCLSASLMINLGLSRRHQALPKNAIANSRLSLGPHLYPLTKRPHYKR